GHDLDLVVAVFVRDGDASARGGEGDQAPVGSPGGIDVAAVALREALDLAGLDVDLEDVEATSVTTRVGDPLPVVALSGAPVGALVVVARLGDPSIAAATGAHPEDLRTPGAVGDERDLIGARAPAGRAVDGGIVGEARLDVARRIDRVDLAVAVLRERQRDRAARGAHGAAEVEAGIRADARGASTRAHPQVGVALGVAGEDHLAAGAERRKDVERAVRGDADDVAAVHLHREHVLRDIRAPARTYERDA